MYTSASLHNNLVMSVSVSLSVGDKVKTVRWKEFRLCSEADPGAIDSLLVAPDPTCRPWEAASSS